jgi:hypothetical protein
MGSSHIGFVGSSPPASPHHESFKAFIPRDIDFTIVQEAGPKRSLYDARGKVEPLIEQVRGLIERQKWDGVIISGAPKEALNPGMWERVSQELKVPIAMALRSSVAALKAFSTQRVLLMTPVDDRLKEMYHDYLADFGIESFSPPQILRSVTDAQKLSSGEVEDMTRNALVEYPDVDAIYFQGALLDPLPVLEKMENAFKLPVVASNPAMLWVILSRLGLRYSIQGYGRLLASWPAIPTGPF